VPSASAPPSGNSDYVDLQPGWRLTVVTPILKSGGYVVRTSPTNASGNAIELKADADFIGYEISRYLITARRNGVLNAKFDSAQVTKDGRTEAQPRSIVALFQLPSGVKYIRLIYLVRQSGADHNMAVVSAAQIEALDSITREVQKNPNEACQAGRRATCLWIPAGIAVRPEVRKIVNGATAWVDAVPSGAYTPQQ